MQELGPTFSPPQLAKHLGCKVERVHNWIRRGELVAINVADSSRRPLWRISLDSIEKFEAARSSQPPAPKPKRRKRQQNVIEFY
jgi:hypothetical protein